MSVATLPCVMPTTAATSGELVVVFLASALRTSSASAACCSRMAQPLWIPPATLLPSRCAAPCSLFVAPLIST